MDKVVNEFESYFLSYTKYKLSNHNNYLQLSTQECFAKYLRDIMKILLNNIENKLNNNYSLILIKGFYSFMLKDKVLKNIDTLGYGNLLLRLKQYSENNSISKEEQYLYFQNFKNSFIYHYEKELYSMLHEECKNPSNDFDRYYYLSKNALNVLVYNHDHRFIKYCFTKLKDTTSVINILNHLFYGKDKIKIYIPVNNHSAGFLSFLDASNQKYRTENQIQYLELHDGLRTNFYSIITEQMRRTDSLMNLYRLYHKSQTDYLYDEKIIIESDFFSSKIEILFKDVISYGEFKLQTKNFNRLSENLSNLKDGDNDLYKKLINSISYAEKGRNIISINAFIDNWISLESLSSITKYKNLNTLDNVIRFVKESIISKMITTDLNYILKDSKRKKFSLETFIDMSKKNLANVAFETEVDLYKRHILMKYSFSLSDISKLKLLYQKIENQIERDLTRIYNLRNEFVHENNINLNYQMEGQKLKYILVMVMDEIFKNLDQKIDYDYNESFGIGSAIYSNIKSKYENRNYIFDILDNRKKIKDINLSEIIENGKIPYEIMVTNILLNNKHILKEYVRKTEYIAKSIKSMQK